MSKAKKDSERPQSSPGDVGLLLVDDEETESEEYAVDTVKDNGQMSRSYGRRMRAHIAREASDRDNQDVPDEPPPGWPV